MLKTILSAIIGLLGIGIMVFVHEGGHYLAARTFGIFVEVFSFGMGPKVFSWKRKETEFRISLLPFGGYCRMRGSDDLTRALESKQKEFEHAEAGSLFSVAPWRRLLTYLAGPMANILFAITVYTFFSMMSYQTLSDPPRIVVTSDYPTLFSMTEREASEVPAALAGLHTGDEVVRYNGQAIEDYQQLLTLLKASEGSTVTLDVLRDGQPLEIALTPARKEDGGGYFFGISSYIEPVVERVTKDSPEYLAGLRPGDRIVVASDTPIMNMLDLSSLLLAKPAEITLTVERDGGTFALSFIPSVGDDGTPTFNFSLHSDTKTVKGLGFHEGLAHSIGQAFRLVGNTFISIGQVITGKADIRSSFTGPWRASMMIGDITTQGFSDSPKAGIRAMLYLLGVVSISLAVANLLPIPALDGGLIMMSVIEMLLHKQVSPRTYLMLQFIGMGCVLLILGFMTFTDMRYFWLNRG